MNHGSCLSNLWILIIFLGKLCGVDKVLLLPFCIVLRKPFRPGQGFMNSLSDKLCISLTWYQVHDKIQPTNSERHVYSILCFQHHDEYLMNVSIFFSLVGMMIWHLVSLFLLHHLHHQRERL